MTLTRIPSVCVVSLALASCVASNPENLGELETSGGSESDSDPSSTSPSSTSVSSTTVEPTTEPSTTAQPTTDSESESTRGETESETGSGTDPQTESETGEPLMCEDPELAEYFPAGCPDTQAGVQLPGAGCYEECAGPESPCEVGRCTLAQVDPCPCADDPEACCDACSGQQWLCLDERMLGACAPIIGRTFTSLEELECGLGPDGVELCNWSVAFDFDGTFIWMHSDIGDGGEYNCDGAVITVANGPQIDVTYDEVNDILTWDGVQYE